MKDLSYFETLILIDEVKRIFEYELEKSLDLIKVQSPLFVKTSSGLQDALSGVEKAVGFTKSDEEFEVVHSLAKWKREALGKYEFPMHKGLYTDMKAIRKDEQVDDLHSMYVEQWDWEKVISKEDRTIDYLKDTVRSIYDALKRTSDMVYYRYGIKEQDLPEEITFITTQEMEDAYPDLTPVEREEIFTKKYGAVFIIGIGDKLKSGQVHDLRSPDYDDWQLDGDILVYDKTQDRAIEISSMGIRVDEDSLFEQLDKADAMDRLALPFHHKIMTKQIPYSIGGGIGQSRVLMLLMGKQHIAEVQASSWESKTLKLIKDKKIL
ncbi:MAG: aspartate--ammonia ligase [Bacilli bacterium]|nr:aspartate--ammonia ligase [Bacilli bacterium]